MSSLVLPLLALAIALTPVVVSARVAYVRELGRQARGHTLDEGHVSPGSEGHRQSDRVKTTVG